MMKMYIVIKETVPVGLAVNSVAHGILIADKMFKDDLDYKDWKENSFRKVTCKATEHEFDALRESIPADDLVVVTESALQHMATVLIIKPGSQAKSLKYLRLFA